MPDQSDRIDSILFAAAELATPEERSDYIRRECGANDELRLCIEKLLNAHYRAGSFLESPTFALASTAEQHALFERPGSLIGPYKLLQQIGEGGMGVVFMAEQSQPIQRTVAVKIIKPGMDSRQVIARFEAERQALAMMDHPNIAKVLDAGATSTGRPFFVMELVKGVPITKYCDDRKFTIRQRLALFLNICHAVQHAHQKGIIHRDLKPTNVLVAEYDDHAIPKIIDFGVAKATAQKLTDRTMFTEFGQIIGTVEYMSPEQAKFNQLDTDTRSDIYSLGVILYELLTGATPFDRQRMRAAALDEVLRIIREEEPPKPSTRLSTSSALPEIAANRLAETAKLSKAVSGELDWIAMKSLEKERQRRYQTASALADDLQNYLNDRPVAACPPSSSYRLRKFVRRNKLAVAAGSAVVAAILIGFVLATIGLVQANRQMAIAQKNGLSMGWGWSLAFMQFGELEKAESIAREALASTLELFPDDDFRMGESLHTLSQVIGQTKPQEAISLARQAIPYRRKCAVDDRSRMSLGMALDNLAILLERQGEAIESEALFREELVIWRKLFGNEHIYVANTLAHLSAVLAMQEKWQDAERSLRDSVAIRAKLRGDTHPTTIRAKNDLERLLQIAGKGEVAP